jgi:hypothetical protein
MPVICLGVTCRPLFLHLSKKLSAKAEVTPQRIHRLKITLGGEMRPKFETSQQTSRGSVLDATHFSPWSFRV